MQFTGLTTQIKLKMLLPFGTEWDLTEPQSQMQDFQTEAIFYKGLVQGSSLNTILGKIYYIAECGSKLR